MSILGTLAVPSFEPDDEEFWLPQIPQLPDSSWMDRGRCKDPDLSGFFASKASWSRLATNANFQAARTVCDHCPVRQKCLEWAMEVGETGVWGGTNDEERRQMSMSGSSTTRLLTANRAGTNEETFQFLMELERLDYDESALADFIGTSRKTVMNKLSTLRKRHGLATNRDLVQSARLNEEIE